MVKLQNLSGKKKQRRDGFVSEELFISFIIFSDKQPR